MLLTNPVIEVREITVAICNTDLGSMLYTAIMYRTKPEEFCILSCEKRSRPKAEAFFTAKNGEPRGF